MHEMANVFMISVETKGCEEQEMIIKEEEIKRANRHRTCLNKDKCLIIFAVFQHFHTFLSLCCHLV